MMGTSIKQIAAIQKSLDFLRAASYFQYLFPHSKDQEPYRNTPLTNIFEQIDDCSCIQSSSVIIISITC